MSAHSISTESEGLKKIVDHIDKLTRQGPVSFPSDENKICYLRSAVLGFEWSLTPIRSIVPMVTSSTGSSLRCTRALTVGGAEEQDFFVVPDPRTGNGGECRGVLLSTLCSASEGFTQVQYSQQKGNDAREVHYNPPWSAFLFLRRSTSPQRMLQVWSKLETRTPLRSRLNNGE